DDVLVPGQDARVHGKRPDLIDVDLEHVLDGPREAEMRTRLQGRDVTAEAQHQSALRRLDSPEHLVDQGRDDDDREHRPHGLGRLARARALRPARTPAEQPTELLLHLAYDFIEIGRTLLVAAPTPGIAIVVVRIVPSHYGPSTHHVPGAPNRCVEPGDCTGLRRPAIPAGAGPAPRLPPALPSPTRRARAR